MAGAEERCESIRYFVMGIYYGEIENIDVCPTVHLGLYSPIWGGRAASGPRSFPCHLMRPAKLNHQTRKENAMETFTQSLMKRLFAGVALLVLLFSWQGPAAAGALLVGDYSTGNI